MKNQNKKVTQPKNKSYYLAKAFSVLMCFMLIMTISVLVVSADEGAGAGADAESTWNTVMSTISTWVTRLGIVTLVVGGIMFGLGWKDNDTHLKSQGIGTMVSGGIVTAMASLLNLAA